MTLADITAVVSDMDGVLWRGDEPLPGLIEFFNLLHHRAVPYILATNNSSKSPADYIRKLNRLGVQDVPESVIMTSGLATAAYLRERHPAGTRVHVLGGDGLRQAMTQAGFTLVDSDAAIVVSGLDWELNYEKLQRATYLIRAGALFVGTNPDTTFPMPEGQSPGAGSILAALAAATDQQPLIIGKPHTPMFEAALELLGHPASTTLMIGDRLNTDIVGAAQLGMRTALVLSGISTAAEIDGADVQPDMIFPNLLALLEAL